MPACSCAPLDDMYMPSNVLSAMGLPFNRDIGDAPVDASEGRVSGGLDHNPPDIS